MSRRRHAPDLDYICLRCSCVCDPPWAAKPLRHRGGGPGMKSCGREPVPILRAEMEAEARQIVAMVRRMHTPPSHQDRD